MEFWIEHDMAVRRFGSGRPLIWIHGLGEQSASFDPVTKLLPGYAHVLPDLPGYGRSAWRKPESIEETVDRLARWVTPDAVLIGHSLGGVLAQLVAERVRVAGVIDVDGNLSLGDCTFSNQAVAHPADDFATHGFDTLRDVVYKSGIANPALRGYYVGMRMADPYQFHRHGIELVELSRSETLAGRLAALAVPKTFIAGHPGGISPRSFDLLKEHAVEYTRIDPSGHWPFIDEPAAFVEAVTRFLSRLSAT
jgi:pimeloyl-ACP methyl ester carboxylesterase